MPFGEIEPHPYLNIQVNLSNANVERSNQLLKYNSLIVGTFPIYALTSSLPIEIAGADFRTNWTDFATMQYFYGSKKSHFYKLFANAFHNMPGVVNMPASPAGAITLLDNNGFFITDSIISTQRRGYDSSDSSISRHKVLNGALLNIILEEGHNIDRIFFTSDVAKQWFSLALNIPYNRARISKQIINAIPYELRTLITPAGNGRSALHYFADYPPTIQEMANQNLNLPYALSYRKRYYHDFLNRII